MKNKLGLVKGKKYRLKKLPLSKWVELGKRAEMGMEVELHKFSGKQGVFTGEVYEGSYEFRLSNGQEWFFVKDMIDDEKYKVIEYVLNGEEK